MRLLGKIGNVVGVAGLMAVAAVGGSMLTGTASAATTTAVRAADTPVSPNPSASPTTPVQHRGYCVRSGTGELRNLWLDINTGKCPAPFWGPVNLTVSKS